MKACEKCGIEQIERVMPHNLEAEKALLGAVLLSSKALLEVVSLVAADEFYHPAHRVIFRAVLSLDASSQPVDTISVGTELERAGELEVLNGSGGRPYLNELLGHVVTLENVAYYAREVAGKAERRRWIMAAHEIALAGYGEGTDEDHRQQSEQKLLALGTRRTADGPVRLKETLHELTKAIDKRYEHRGQVSGLSSGYGRLDEMTAGLQPGDLFILAARPGMGKTALALNFVVNATENSTTTVLVFSLEMSRLSLSERMVASDGRVDGMRLRTGQIQAPDWTRILAATSRLSERNVYVDDSGVRTIAEIRAVARRWSARQHQLGLSPGLVVVDYLQLVAGAPTRNRNSNREQEVSEISRGLKGLAKELDCPVVALSQLNRSVENRADKRPTLSDLRESGAIEQDADVIAFIYRDEVYNEDSPKKGIAEVIIGKQRNGPTGCVELAWLPAFSKFENLAYRSES